MKNIMKDMAGARRVPAVLVMAAMCLCAEAQLLYRISGGGPGSPSYVFGTHHVAPVSITERIAGFEKAFGECGQLYGELEMDSAGMSEAQALMMRAMMAPADSGLTALYTKDELAEIDSAMRLYFGMGVEQLAVMKPAAVSMQLTMAQTLKAFPDYKPEMQLDAYLQRRAAARGMPVKGLESVELQIEALFGMPMEEQAGELLEMVRMERQEELARKMADLYMTQRCDELYELMINPEMGGDEKWLERVLYGRNEAWAEKMPEIMRERPTFFVVGAGHLSGERGVLKLLEKAGYKVEPVM